MSDFEIRRLGDSGVLSLEYAIGYGEVAGINFLEKELDDLIDAIDDFKFEENERKKKEKKEEF